MSHNLQAIPERKNKNLSIWLSFIGLAAGLVIAVLSYLNLLPLGYKLGPYWLNHWAGWLAIAFIVIYVPIFIILKRKKPEIYQRLIKVHEIGFILAFIVVSLHIGSQIRRVFPPEIGTGIAAYVSLFVLVITGIMQRNQILSSRIGTLRFVHLSMALSFFLVIIFHIIFLK